MMPEISAIIKPYEIEKMNAVRLIK